jgi:hypothetical protein
MSLYHTAGNKILLTGDEIIARECCCCLDSLIMCFSALQDYSSYNHTISTYGSPTIVSNELSLDGSSGLNAPSDPSFALGSGDWTIELFVNFDTLPTIASTLIASGGPGPSRWTGWSLKMIPSGLIFEYDSADGSPIDVSEVFSWSPSTSTWYHVALSKVSGNIRAFVDGTQIDTTRSDSTNMTLQFGIQIGYHGTSGGSEAEFLDGLMDDIILTTCEGRYSSSFTAPSRIDCDSL